MAVNVNGAAATIGNRSLCATSTGRLWQALLNSTTIQMWYSDDSGATWTQNTSAQITGVTANTVCSLFIDADDHAHIAYVTTTNSAVEYRRMASISTSTSWASADPLTWTIIPTYTVAGIVAHREGTGWVAHTLVTKYDSGASVVSAQCIRLQIPASGANSVIDDTAVGSAAIATGLVATGLDFHHTAASVTAIQGATPHIYAAWVTGANAQTVKATYASGVWTWGTVRTLGTDVSSASHAAMIFDGSRVLMPVRIASSTPTMKLYERDAADTTTTARTLTSVTIVTVNVTYDGNEDVWLFGDTDLNPGAGETRYKVYDRSADTWGSETTVEAEVNTGNMVTVRRGGGYDMDAVWGITGSVRFERTGAPHPPTAPTWVTPVDFAGADVGASLVLDWTFNDPHPSDTQGKYAVRRQIGAGTLYYWRASDSTWQTSETANVSATTSLTLASSWGADGDANHKYAVKTWDSGYTEGVYGVELTVVPSTPDLPTITTPTDAASWVTSSITVVWTATTQTTYLVELLNSAGTTVLWSSGTLSSTSVRSQAVSYTLANGVSYKARVTTANDEGLVGTADTNSFSVAYTGPATPTLTVTGNTPAGAITVEHTNPTPTGSQPDVTSVDIFVRCTAGTYPDGERPVAGNGIRVKTGLAPDADWIDYAPASGRAYQYMVRAYGDNGTTGDSAWTA